VIDLQKCILRRCCCVFSRSRSYSRSRSRSASRSRSRSREARQSRERSASRDREPSQENMRSRSRSRSLPSAHNDRDGDQQWCDAHLLASWLSLADCRFWQLTFLLYLCRCHALCCVCCPDEGIIDCSFFWLPFVEAALWPTEVVLTYLVSKCVISVIAGKQFF